DGVLQQCDEPEKVYHSPANKFVASFIGSPPMNFIPAKITSSEGTAYVDADDFKFALPAGHAAASMSGKSVTLGIRPEDIFDVNVPSNVSPDKTNTISAKVDVLEPLGPEYVAYLQVGRHNMIATITNETRIKETQTAEFAVNLERIHLFDDETEQAIR
ncbi:MAG TPA: TOBE domain-containing protein, partial [Fimbriimonas sp.]|nr:TOBE domain-containing protein [Fimbriimonas sp.]